MTIEYHLKEIANDIANERAAHKIAIERLQASAGLKKLNSEWKPVKFMSIRVGTNSSSWLSQTKIEVSRYCSHNDKTEHTYPMTDEGLAAAIAKIKELHEEDREAHETNMEAVVENRAILNSFAAMLQTIGVSQTVKEYNSRKKRSENVSNPIFNQVCTSAPEYSYADQDLDRRIADFTNRLTDMLKAEEAKAAKKAEEERARKLTNPLLADAIAWLAVRGKVVGIDYKMENAVEVANELAFDEEIAQIKAANEWQYVSGNDECTHCRGWDGSSPRCECGTYRVSWECGYGHSFKTPSVLAMIN